MTDKYNGWTNYETWCVNLWLQNDEASYHTIRELCQDGDEEYSGSQKLKDFVEEECDRLLENMTTSNSPAGLDGTFEGIVTDIFRANLHSVDWAEIWRAFRE